MGHMQTIMVTPSLSMWVAFCQSTTWGRVYRYVGKTAHVQGSVVQCEFFNLFINIIQLDRGTLQRQSCLALIEEQTTVPQSKCITLRNESYVTTTVQPTTFYYYDYIYFRCGTIAVSLTEDQVKRGCQVKTVERDPYLKYPACCRKYIACPDDH